MKIQENCMVRFPDDFFEKVFNDYSSGLLVYAKHYVLMHDVAEDIVHDVFVNYWEKKEKIDRDKIKSYLFTATRNGCLNYLKMRSRYRGEVIDSQINPPPPGYFDEDMYVPADIKAMVDTAIARLPPKRRRAFMMHRFEKKTFAEIAKELEVSPKTIDKHVELALKDLRRELSNYLYLLVILNLICH